MEGILRFMTNIAQFRGLFLILFEIAFVVVLGTLAYALYKKLKWDFEESKRLINHPTLKHEFKADLGEVERQNAIRQIIAADGVDANPNTYM